jgi:hypothetical protein
MHEGPGITRTEENKIMRNRVKRSFFALVMLVSVGLGGTASATCLAKYAYATDGGYRICIIDQGSIEPYCLYVCTTKY